MDLRAMIGSPEAIGGAPAEDERGRLAHSLMLVAGGDRAALAEVYRRTSARLFGLCLRVLGERAEAEDALHDVYLTVWRKAGSFDPRRGSAMSWLVALTRNRAIDRLRASGRRRHSALDATADIASGERDARELLEADEEQQRLLGCLDALVDGDRHVIRTAFFEGASYSDLAARIEVPLGTLKSRIRRALFKLRDCLK